jgi:hypothetical protein
LASIGFGGVAIIATFFLEDIGPKMNNKIEIFLENDVQADKNKCKYLFAEFQTFKIVHKALSVEEQVIEGLRKSLPRNRLDIDMGYAEPSTCF